MAKYQALTKTFIAPHLIEEGQVFTISDSFEPGIHLLPLDEAAEAAFEKYEEKRRKLNLPPATLDPIEQLPNTITSIEDPAQAQPDLSISLAEAAAGPAKPGPTDGGKVLSHDGKTPAAPPANPKIGKDGEVDPDKKDPSEVTAKSEGPAKA